MAKTAKQYMYKSENVSHHDRIAAKNRLESYASSIKMTMEGKEVKDTVSEEDQQKVISKCEDIIDWLGKNQTAEKDEFEYQQTELEKVCNPIITSLYQKVGMPGRPGRRPDGRRCALV